MNLGLLLALSGVAISVFVSGIGSARGVAIVGKAGAGVVAEDPEKFSQVLPLQALPGTQGIYGFLIGFVILIRLDIFGELAEISTSGGTDDANRVTTNCNSWTYISNSTGQGGCSRNRYYS